MLLKHEDLTHTGSHKINNVLGQALLARRMGKERVIAETGAGQHGVARRQALLFGLECKVFMGAVDVERQALQRLPDEAPRRRGRARRVGSGDAQGRQRDVARLGRQRRHDALLHRLRGRSASVSGWCESSSGSSATRHAGSAGRSSTGPTPISSSRASVGDPTPSARSRSSSTRRTCAWSASRRGGLGLESGKHGGVGQPRGPGCPPRRPVALPPGRRRSDPRSEFDQRRARLPGRRARVRAAGATGAPSTRTRPTTKRSPASSLSVMEGIVPAPRARARHRGCARKSADRFPAGSTVLVTLSGAATRTRAQVAERHRRAARVKLEAHSRRTAGRGHSSSCRTSPAVWASLGSSGRSSCRRGRRAIEIGIPFSDPVMDGRTVQRASAAGSTRRPLSAKTLPKRRSSTSDPTRGDDLLQPRRPWVLSACLPSCGTPASTGDRSRCPAGRARAVGATSPTRPVSKRSCLADGRRPSVLPDPRAAR